MEKDGCHLESTMKAIKLGHFMSPNIHKHPRLEPIKATPPELELIEAMPSEPKIWDTSDVTKYS